MDGGLFRREWPSLVQPEPVEVDERLGLPVLADTGHLDVAYELLASDTEPSWLTMIDRGATTVWERWNGVSADGVPHESLNHYSKGAVISLLHRYAAGIELLDDGPAYRRFRIRPPSRWRLDLGRSGA